MSPTKQGKSQGNSGKEPKLHQGQNGEKKKHFGRTQAQSEGQFSSGQQIEQCMNFFYFF